jgi:hypothetical protein
METLFKTNFTSFPQVKSPVASIITPENEYLEIFEYVDSGKVITREKVDTLTKVFHPGIIIGKDKWGRIWVAHNHYSNNRPTFDLLVTFCSSKQALWDNRPVKFSREQIVERAIAEVLKGKEYKWANYNCQIFVNLVVREEHISEAVDKISDAAMIGGLGLTLLGLFTKNKALTATGLAIAGTGGVAKGYSRIRK